MAPKIRRIKKKQNNQDHYIPKNKLFIDLSQDLSDHAAELLWGQGFLATYKDKKANERLQELIKYNNFDEGFFYMEKLLSLFGNIYSTLDMVNGKPTWLIADPYLNSQYNNPQVPSTDGTIYGMGRALVLDQVAVIWKKITYGTIAFPIKEIHHPDRVERIFYGENNKRITVASVNEKLPPELQLKELWVHNIGLIDGKLPTIKWHKNQPTFNGRSYPDGYKGISVQNVLNKTLSELWHETETNRTRVIGSLDETTYNQIMKNGDLQEINKNDFLINVRMKNSTGEQANELIPIIADPKFEQYWKSIQKAKDEFYQLGGYSPLGDGNTEKTATENILMKTNDYQTTKKKRDLRYKEMGELFKALIVMDSKLGYGQIYDIDNFEDNFTLEIMENKVMDSLKEMDNYEKMYELGIMSRLEIIAKQRGITMEEAEKIKKDIDKEKEEDKPEDIDLEQPNKEEEDNA